MYDAVMVRRSSGEQGTAIQELIKELKSKVIIPRAAKGHTPEEVLRELFLASNWHCCICRDKLVNFTLDSYLTIRDMIDISLCCELWLSTKG